MYLLWSIIGFAVIVCFWGLVNLVANCFNFDNSAPTIFGSMFGSSSSGCGSSGSNSSNYWQSTDIEYWQFAIGKQVKVFHSQYLDVY